MNWYNGFSPQVRAASCRWLNQQYKLGVFQKPTVCCACGQGRGWIEAHAEDYSQPFGPHIQEFGLCYRCHMMIHCRLSAPGPWDLYRVKVREGHQAEPINSRNFGEIQRQLLGREPVYTRRSCELEILVLDNIHNCVYLAKIQAKLAAAGERVDPSIAPSTGVPTRQPLLFD